MPPPHDALPTGHDFAAYARTHWPRLLVTARLLTDDDGAAEELVRRTLARLCARWRRVPRDDVDFHVLRCLVRVHLRRPRGRRAARRRTVLVLRFQEGLTDTEIAQVLGCSPGAVRARVRHGLRAAGADPGRLREVYADAARDVVPSEVPLAEVQARGRVLRRRRIAVASAVCAALLAPAALLGADLIRGGDAGNGESAAGATHAAASPVRVVTSGERVTAGPGIQVWLTADGGHWSVPWPVAGDDGDRPLDEPGVSVRVDTVKGGFVLSGLFHGLRGEPSRVAVRTGDGGAATAKVLVLAGSAGWGVWYAKAPLPEKNMKALLADGGDEPMVTVYDAAGKAVARSDREWWRI
ncbi:sigma factor-like helix-turn-helix DNA-binding protein [Streptomyces ferrugineus]|uniref:sigma factor-like helix-turn-helix DNA-binding protein n=1 Tax=Streptomyces ferrugineus TaxID=1413221 RepID=UPI001D15C002|nr:sigma factor-like helix-turn-helix DNA-binding protein [Streptomyces ferrugineus]